MLGIYIHIPFCSSICNYCNFNRGLFDAALKDRYMAALEREIQSSEPGRADTIYFGGGTPSLLEAGEIGRVIHAVRSRFDVAADAEVTLETNPETSTPERMAAFRAAGVNRLSFGVQSFREPELRRLGRVHSVERARAAVGEARSAGFDNISLDLMMWLPEQTLAHWQESVEALIETGPEHASLYLLELYPNAPLKDDMARAGWSLAPDDDAAEMYLWSMARLERAGYRQYEISNVARAARESRHNLKYWRDGEWAAFGSGAHATRGNERTRNAAATGEYVSRVEADQSPIVERRVLSPEEKLQEALFTGLRLVEGVDVVDIGARYGIDVVDRFGRALEPFFAAGVLRLEGPRLCLSREGMLVANEVMAVFV